MVQEEPSVEDALKAIRALMSGNSTQNESEDDILELTEDDLCPDELKDDIVNENLTKISDDVNIGISASKKIEERLTIDREEILVSAENAAKSIKTIKYLIQKAQNPESKLSSNKSLNLETDKAVKALLEDWLNDKLPLMLKEVVEKEIKRLILNKEDILK